MLYNTIIVCIRLCLILTAQWNTTIVPTQVEKMRAEVANLNHCAEPFLSRAAANMCWYYYKYYRKKERCKSDMRRKS